MVMLVLIIVSILGVGAAQIALMSERGSRNDRDMQIAWQGSEAGLLDAESDLFDTTAGTTRNASFDGKDLSLFTDVDCGTVASANEGLCATATTGKPSWLRVDFADTSSSARTVAFGSHTAKTFPAGSAGIQSAAVPRYVIEVVTDPTGRKDDPTYMYRVTSMGFGPRREIQAVTQILYRK